MRSDPAKAHFGIRAPHEIATGIGRPPIPRFGTDLIAARAIGFVSRAWLAISRLSHLREGIALGLVAPDALPDLGEKFSNLALSKANIQLKVDFIEF